MKIEANPSTEKLQGTWQVAATATCPFCGSLKTEMEIQKSYSGGLEVTFYCAACGKYEGIIS